MSIFQDVLVRKPSRSAFNLSHERKFSADFAYLYPICCIETVPGDTFKLSTEVLVRTAPLIAPVMHRVNVKVNYFFVPNRLLWLEWKDFITGINQSGTYNPALPNDPNYFVTKVPPYFELNSSASATIQGFFKDGSLADFLGFPTIARNKTVAGTTNVQLLPFRAYQQIYNDWYRNQNVEAEVVFNKTSGQNTTRIAEHFILRKRMWEKDYFTSALPFAQRGDEVHIPVRKEGSIEFDTQGGQTPLVNPLTGTKITTSGNVTNGSNGLAVSSTAVAVDNSANLRISDSALGSINDLRIATKLQHWLEVNARVGGRYIEQILGHFGVRSSDARLQRAEYLGGWSQPIIVSDVEQTSAFQGDDTGAVGTTPQGNLAGKGTAYGSSNNVKCFCEEHGFIIGILSILPRTTYQDGMPRMFQRNFKEDYYFPEFAHLGEQEVNKAEVFYDISDSNNQSFDRFGFQERYCEYKYIPSTVHGEFKNNLQFWHLGRDFRLTGQPALNKSFVEAQPRNNIFAVESGANHFYVNLINHISALRPMPKQAIPTL